MFIVGMWLKMPGTRFGFFVSHENGNSLHAKGAVTTIKKLAATSDQQTSAFLQRPFIRPAAHFYMADSKRPLESKDPKPIAEAMAGTLDAPVLHPRNRTKRQKVQG